MELDGFCKELNLAFEYNGIQHYKFVKFFHRTLEKLKIRQLDDIRKIELCKKNNINLIIIPYNIKNIKTFILEKCEELGYDFSKTIIKNTPNTYKQKHNKLKKLKEFQIFFKNKKNCIIKSSDKFKDGGSIGKYWCNIKNRDYCNKYKEFKTLLNNPILKENYNKYQINKTTNLTLEEQINELLELIKKQKKIKITDKFTDNKNMYQFWREILKHKKCSKPIYNKLLSNHILKNKYNKFIKTK
jgi:hypothetical protein